MGVRQQGFSLIEMMVVMVIFLIVSGAVFALLDTAQVRYRAEQQFLESFQGGRLGVELMVRDIHNAGYPPPYTFAGNLPPAPAGPTPAAYPAPVPWTDPSGTDPTDPAPDLQRRFAVGIAGLSASGGGLMHVESTCTVDTINPNASTCNMPSPWDVFVELDVDPENPNPDPVTGLVPQVEWVRYNLIQLPGAQTASLFRTVSPKIVGVPPTANQSVIPFVENVTQDPTQAVNGVLPDGSINVPLFRYECDPQQLLAPGVCLAENIKYVYISLRVRSSQADIRTRQFRQITIQGMARRLNPSR